MGSCGQNVLCHCHINFTDAETSTFKNWRFMHSISTYACTAGGGKGSPIIPKAVAQLFKRLWLAKKMHLQMSFLHSWKRCQIGSAGFLFILISTSVMPHPYTLSASQYPSSISPCSGLRFGIQHHITGSDSSIQTVPGSTDAFWDASSAALRMRWALFSHVNWKSIFVFELETLCKIFCLQELTQTSAALNFYKLLIFEFSKSSIYIII